MCTIAWQSSLQKKFQDSPFSESEVILPQRVINKNPMCGVSLLILCLLCNGSTKISTLALQFPDNFIFGASTSSYQIEGAWNADGKGENVWDRLTHTNPSIIKDGKNGDDAAKSYYLYKNDSDLLKEIGFNMYRFSISWARILPNGDLSQLNDAGIQHYNDVLNDLLEKNIEPMVTMYHLDMPQKLQEVGGWLNSSIVDHMKNYADILFSNFGDRVKWWITINEPYYVVVTSRALGNFINDTNAPSLDLGYSSDYIKTHNILLAHMRVYRLYETKYKAQQNGKVTISLNYETCFPKTQSQEDIDATERHYQFSLGIFAHPIFSAEGDYPALVRKIVDNNSKAEGLTQSRLPVFSNEEMTSLRGSFDYFSVNHYSSSVCSSVSQNDSLTTTSPFYKDINVHTEPNSSLPVTEKSKWEINSNGFKVLLNIISKEYNNTEIFITENGYGGFGELNDTSRIEYYRDYLTKLLEAYNDGCKVIGYTIWSLLDNFEWTEGYGTRFGIVHVDYNSENRERTRKQSSYFFEELIKTRAIPS